MTAPKFQVGDVVRCINPTISNNLLQLMAVGVVVELSAHRCDPRIQWFDQSMPDNASLVFWSADRFDLIPPPPTPAYRPPNYVTFTDAAHPLLRGHTGIFMRTHPTRPDYAVVRTFAPCTAKPRTQAVLWKHINLSPEDTNK